MDIWQWEHARKIFFFQVQCYLQLLGPNQALFVTADLNHQVSYRRLEAQLMLWFSVLLDFSLFVSGFGISCLRKSVCFWGWLLALLYWCSTKSRLIKNRLSRNGNYSFVTFQAAHGNTEYSSIWQCKAAKVAASVPGCVIVRYIPLCLWYMLFAQTLGTDAVTRYQRSSVSFFASN